MGEDGKSTPAADGDYKVEGKTIKVVDGKVSEIVEDAPAPAPAEESAEVGKTGIKGLDNLSRILSAK